MSWLALLLIILTKRIIKGGAVTQRPENVSGNLSPVHTVADSQKSATVAENGETTTTVAEFGDSHRFLRQSLFSGQIVAEIGDYIVASVDRLLQRSSGVDDWLLKRRCGAKY